MIEPRAHSIAEEPEAPLGFRVVWKHHTLDYFPLANAIHLVESGRRIPLDRPAPAEKFFAPGPDSETEFKPFCLTLYLGHGCNLACDYCYVVEKSRLPNFSVRDEAVRRAACAVAGHAVSRNRPMVLGFHGGVEPLKHRPLIERLLRIAGQAADEQGVELIRHCTTNGVIPAETAEWAARRFQAITLSWDGPAEVHDRFRRTTEGEATHDHTRATAAIFTGPNSTIAQLKVRATVTRHSVPHLTEIVRYFCEAGIRRVEFYPVFSSPKDQSLLRLAPDAGQFVGQFLLARRWGRNHGVEVVYAGVRFGDLHDKFCTLFQDNLTITPDGNFTACFKRTHNLNSENDPWMFGTVEEPSWQNAAFRRRLGALSRTLSAPYPQCRECFNQYHCAKGCPNVCPVAQPNGEVAPFDCVVEKSIGLATLLANAGIQLTELEELNFSLAYRNAAVSPIFVAPAHGPELERTP